MYLEQSPILAQKLRFMDIVSLIGMRNVIVTISANLFITYFR